MFKADGRQRVARAVTVGEFLVRDERVGLQRLRQALGASTHLPLNDIPLQQKAIVILIVLETRT
jgi:hypothetical protein